MIEIAEVEVYRRLLRGAVLHRKITKTAIDSLDRINLSPEDYIALTENQLLTYVSRLGRYLILEMGNSAVMLVHPGANGKIYFAEKDEQLSEEGDMVLHFADGTSLHFINAGRGWIHVMSQEELVEYKDALGLDPLGEDFTRENFDARTGGEKREIKAVLTDEKIIAGLGSCYADEILYVAGILPDRKMNELDGIARGQLFSTFSLVVQEAAANGGCEDFTFSSKISHVGGHREKLRVYGRDGEECSRCGRKMEKTEVPGKVSYFCPGCQH